MAATMNMLVYSARKNRAKRMPEYSVWKPATSSLSASGRAKGGRVGARCAEGGGRVESDGGGPQGGVLVVGSPAGHEDGQHRQRGEGQDQEDPHVHVPDDEGLGEGDHQEGEEKRQEKQDGCAKK